MMLCIGIGIGLVLGFTIGYLWRRPAPEHRQEPFDLPKQKRRSMWD